MSTDPTEHSIGSQKQKRNGIQSDELKKPLNLTALGSVPVYSVSYVRASWGNGAPPVTASEVNRYRSTPLD
jgi:hypothetical protein